MPKTDTIEAIRKLNPTARPEFLVEFSNGELRDYLRQLEGVRKEHGDDAARMACTCMSADAISGDTIPHTL